MGLNREGHILCAFLSSSTQWDIFSRLTVSHLVREGEAEDSLVNHPIGQVSVEPADCGLQVAQLVQHHHASLNHRQSCPVRDSILPRVLFSEIPEERQLLQTSHPVYNQKEGKTLVISRQQFAI